MLLSRAVHQVSSCPAHAHRARASCLPDSNPYGRDGLAHSRSLSTARRALRVAQVGVASFINQFIYIILKRMRVWVSLPRRRVALRGLSLHRRASLPRLVARVHDGLRLGQVLYINIYYYI